MDQHEFTRELWHSYSQIAPSVNRIKSLFEDRGETVLNDHIAFRTIDTGPISIANLQLVLFDLGYKVFDTYLFKEKKLVANAYIHETDKTLPKIFLSGLQYNYLTKKSQDILLKLVEQLYWNRLEGYLSSPDAFIGNNDLWNPIKISDYKTLLSESEYAAWVATFGIRPNHFTVSINNLKNFKTVESVLSLVEDNGFWINESGGRVKGTPEILLEQGSTMAESITIKFADGKLEVPSCYYEFALRYPDKNGNLYQGFVEKSADKIFESTDNK